jgi:hypothetical protein
MSFEPVKLFGAPRSRIRQVRFAIVQIAGLYIGRLSIPASYIGHLVWRDNEELQVLVGSGDDVGFYLIHPSPTTSDGRKPARLKISPSGVGHYATRVLAPPSLQRAMATASVVGRIEGNKLLIKLF